MKNFTVLIKESFEIYKQKIKSILKLMIIFWGLSIIFGILTSLMSPESIIENGGYLALLFVLCLCLFIIFLYSLITFSFILLAVKPVETKLEEIFQDAWEKLWQYILIVLLVGFFTFLSFLLLFIPGIIVGVYFMFCSYILVIEGGKGIDVLKRSWALVKGNWWKVFGRIVLLNIVVMIIFSILSSVNDLLGSLFQYLCIPFSVIFMYLIYLELKKSKEIQIHSQT